MRRILLVIVFIAWWSSIQAQDIQTGSWQGRIAYRDRVVPFIFKVDKNKSEEYVLTLVNGKESIPIPNLSWKGDSLVIPMHSFDVEIITKVSKDRMTGRWVKNYKSNPGLPFTAKFDQPRFPSKSQSGKVAKLPSQLKMTMTPGQTMAYETIGLFEQKGQVITGTILAKFGDFRYFEGVISEDSIKASSFDGAHALLLLGHLKDGQWSGELVLDNNYSERWVGEIDPDFSLADPFVKIDPDNPTTQEPYFDILTAGSGFNTLTKDDFFGKVTIIQLLGSWCPNSLDETHYLTKWYAANKNRAIDILAVFFEMNYSKEYGLKRISDYVSKNNIPYPTALGGPANKGQAALAFPFIAKLDAFPTLMILDKHGRVRYMHSYFLGPAAGKYYKDFDKRFNGIIDELLKE